MFLSFLSNQSLKGSLSNQKFVMINSLANWLERTTSVCTRISKKYGSFGLLLNIYILSTLVGENTECTHARKQASTLVEARAFKGNIVGWGKGMRRNKESVGGFKLPLPLSACALLWLLRFAWRNASSNLLSVELQIDKLYQVILKVLFFFIFVFFVCFIIIIIILRDYRSIPISPFRGWLSKGTQDSWLYRPFTDRPNKRWPRQGSLSHRRRLCRTNPHC